MCDPIQYFGYDACGCGVAVAETEVTPIATNTSTIPEELSEVPHGEPDVVFHGGAIVITEEGILVEKEVPEEIQAVPQQSNSIHDSRDKGLSLSPTGLGGYGGTSAHPSRSRTGGATRRKLRGSAATNNEASLQKRRNWDRDYRLVSVARME